MLASKKMMGYGMLVSQGIKYYDKSEEDGANIFRIFPVPLQHMPNGFILGQQVYFSVTITFSSESLNKKIADADYVWDVPKFWGYIEKKLEKEHISKELFATAIGVDKRTLGRYLHSTLVPTNNALRRLCEYFSLDEIQIFGLFNRFPDIFKMFLFRSPLHAYYIPKIIREIATRDLTHENWEKLLSFIQSLPLRLDLKKMFVRKVRNKKENVESITNSTLETESEIPKTNGEEKPPKFPKTKRGHSWL